MLWAETNTVRYGQRIQHYNNFLVIVKCQTHTLPTNMTIAKQNEAL